MRYSVRDGDRGAADLVQFARRLPKQLTSATQFGVFEEFAPPHTFAPRLTVVEAAIASLAALVRISTGSALLAFWGIAMAGIPAGPARRNLPLAPANWHGPLANLP